MVEYAKASYHIWREVKTAEQCLDQYHEFVALCSKLYRYNEQEVLAILSTTSWFIMPR